MISLDQQRHEDDRYIDGMPDDAPGPLPGMDIPDELIENDDGSVTIPDMAAPVQKPQSFQENLVEVLDTLELTTLGTTMVEKFERDREARKKRDEQYKEGLERSGLSGDAPGGASFSGASKVVHPVLAEACVDFAASAIKELFPPDGPVRSKIIGRETDERKERAKRKTTYLNWQYTDQMEEYRDDLEQLLSQVPMGGSQFQKYRYDERLRRPVVEFVPVDEVLLPYAASSFYTAPRVTHVQELTRAQFEERVASGLYIYDGFDPATNTPPDEVSGTQTANDDIEGREATCYNEDGLRIIYESYAWLRVNDPLTGGKVDAPYIVTIDHATEKVVALYRNWAEGDQRLKKLDWWVEWGFIPWRGAYKLGLPHLIGGLTIAATGALRALLDSAHLNNAAAAVKLKGGSRSSGQNVQVEITQVSEIDAPAGVDDIRKAIMPMPFNPPSTVLFELLGWLTQAAKGVVSTSEEKIAEASNTMPVGTAMALIEQGSKVFSAIHARLHASHARGMKILCRINGEWLNDQEVAETFGEPIVTRQDFAHNDDVQPVSDPATFSEAQRYARWQAIIQMSQDPRVQWNVVEMYRDGLRMMRVEDADKYLPPTQQPMTADPVQENVAATLQGVPLQANPQQDHMAHLNEHLRFLTDPLQGASPVMPPPAMQAIFQHCLQHLMFHYMTTTMQGAQQMALQMQAAGLPPPGSPDAMLAQTAVATQEALGEQGQAMAQMLGQVAQMVQSRMPPAPLDPAQATLQAAMAETQRRAQLDQMTLQAKQQEAARADQFRSLELQMKAQGDAFERAMQQQESQSAALMERVMQQVELMKNEQDNKQHQITELLKNRDDNETKVLIAQLQGQIQAAGDARQANTTLNFDVSEALQQALKPYADGLLETQKSVAALGDALRGMAEGQSAHQQRILEMANSLMQGE